MSRFATACKGSLSIVLGILVVAVAGLLLLLLPVVAGAIGLLFIIGLVSLVIFSAMTEYDSNEDTDSEDNSS